MIPLLYKKDGITKIGELTNCIECLVEEERNGIFEVSIVYPTTDSIFNSLEEENIIICDANDTLKAQKFRIYMTRKLMSNKIEVYARHISFDLAYDTVDNIDITNQSCEYVLNTIFRQSQFSTHYRGYSDIVNAQNYKMSMANCIEAIAGKEGSIIDTFGTGAEILRDNTNIHVLNKRGHDNEVSIEYAKNLTGFELEEDYSELVTRINAYAKYTNSETNKEVLVEAKGIDSPLITNYSHPYVSYIDYSDKFENEEIPTKEKLIELAKKEYSINNKDKPKQNYKIEFVPLSKCVGYEGLEDKISLCDTVTIKDTRYGINTKSKVIRTVFDVLKNRYDSMELGEPRTTLGDIIGPGGNVSDSNDTPTTGPQGPPGNNGTNGVDAIYVNLTNDSHVVPTLSDGTGGNYTGCETTIELYKGTDKINFGVSYEAEQIEGVTASLKGNVYSITNMTVDSCNVGLRATYNGKTYLKYFNVSKSKKGVDGTDGVTYYTWIRYADDDKGNGISNDPTGKEYIGFAYNKLTPIESNVPGDYTWSLIKGTDGVPGQNGTDGTTYYTWIKYSDYPDGNPCYELPNSNTKYIGIATNKLSPTESNDPNDYVWSKFKGDDGVDGTDGKDAYTINITNDSHVFASESNGNISKEQTATTKIIAFKGTNTVPFSIGGLPNVAGLRLSKDSTTVTITALIGNTLADSGSFEIPITVEGIQFKKVFSWSKAKKGQDGSLGDFPDTLPITPTLSHKLYGFANIELSWTYENKTYYSYELYASKARDFSPNTFDLIHQGQSSSFLFQARPNETWYFKVCAINSYGRRTPFSQQVAVTTKKIDDLSNYVDNMAINDALIGTLSLDRGWVGQLRGHWIDAKQLSVTDGNGKRTLDIDSFGNIRANVTELSIKSKSVLTEGEAIADINITPGNVKINASKIQLEGAVTVGDNGRKVKIQNSDYTVMDGDSLKAFFGFRSFGENNDKYLVPKFYMGAYGFNPSEHNYFGMTSYRGNGDNPENNTYAYQDLSYRCINSVFSDWSNIKMFSSGDIKLAPVKDLTIYTNYINNKYAGTTENKLAVFSTANSSYFNSHLQIGAIRNMSNSNGLILADDSNSSNDGTRVRVHIDSSGKKYFRPLTTAGDIELGSASYRWNRVFSINADNVSSDRRLKENIEYLQETPNTSTAKSETFTLEDMYNFVKDTLYLTSYNYKEGNKNLKFGFIAQDLLNDKIGDNIVEAQQITDDGEESYLGYDTMNYTHTLAGALKVAIQEIETLKEEIKALKGGA